MSWYMVTTASHRDISRNSLYMLCVPERESYLIQMPKFLTFIGCFSWICKTDSSQPQSRQVAVREGMYLVQRDDFSIGLFDLFQLGQKVPEARLCDHVVWCKNAHAVQLGCGLCIGGEMAPDHLVFLESCYYVLAREAMHWRSA